jgi:hypothetical protein
MSSLKFYAVTGRGFFPTDMLRYDCAEPANKFQEWRIHELAPPREKSCGEPMAWEDYYELVKEVNSEERVVYLMSDLRTAPTVERWMSFGWVVNDVAYDVDGEMIKGAPWPLTRDLNMLR